MAERHGQGQGVVERQGQGQRVVKGSVGSKGKDKDAEWWKDKDKEWSKAAWASES